MRRVAAKLVLRLLMDDQKQSRMNVCRELKKQLEVDPDLFSKVITGDESWCYGYDPETKQQSSQWKHPTSPQPKKSASNEVQCQDDVDLFLRCKRNCPQRICSSWSNCSPDFLLGNSEAFARRGEMKTP